MRKIGFAVVMLMMVASMSYAVTVTPSSGLKGSCSIGPMGGVAVPVGDLSDKNKGNAGVGFNIGGTFDYFVTDAIGIGIDGAYSSSSDKDNSDIKFKTTNFGGHLEWLLPTGGKVIPYLGAGVGYYNRKVEATSGSFSSSFTKGGIGANGGVGVGYMATDKLSIVVDGRYHWTQTIKAADISPSATEDFKWANINFTVGLLWHIKSGGAMGGSKM
jgi:outer membrane protein W